MPFRRTLSSVLLGIAAVSFLAWREYSLTRPGTLLVHFFDVGQGDSSLLVSPSGKQVLIDGGANLSLLEHLGRTMPFFDRTIELLVLTHPDRDHIFSFPEVLKRCEVETILLTGVAHDLPHYAHFLSLLQEKGIPVILADPNRDIAIEGKLQLDILWPQGIPPGEYPENMNNSSIVLTARSEDRSILFTGDIEQKAEGELLQRGVDLHATILKVAHHGSKTSSALSFLKAVSPSLAVISSGRSNRYGHPHGSVLQRLAALEIPVQQTAEEGTITVRLPPT